MKCLYLIATRSEVSLPKVGDKTWLKKSDDSESLCTYRAEKGLSLYCILSATGKTGIPAQQLSSSVEREQQHQTNRYITTDSGALHRRKIENNQWKAPG